jgi:hypothetical protein
MITQQPNVSPLGNRRTRTDLYRFFLLLSFSCDCFLQDQIDFPYFKASDGNIKLEVDRGQMLKLNGQNRMVPTSFLRQLVIRQNIGPDLVFGQIVQADGRHLADAQQFCGCDPTVSGNDRSRAIDKNRVGEAERSDAVRNLTNLAP